MKKNYMPCQDYHMDFSIVNSNAPGYCEPIRKFPITKIGFDKKYLSYANMVREEDVNSIVNDFYIDAWEPIFLNHQKYLIDGQHRLAAAKRMRLKFIDVVIINENPNKFKKKENHDFK